MSYRINDPDTTIKLDSKLSEISGLSMVLDDSLLVSIQDEDGLLFFLDKRTGELVEQQKFAGDEDYEGIEVVGDTAYVVNSKGDMEVIELVPEVRHLKKVKTLLKRDDDVEGLGYSAEGQSLLMACKSNREGKRRDRYVYRYDLQTEKLNPDPFLVLDPEAVAKNLQREKKTPYFSPSALAVHPLSGEIYIISSPAAALVVYDKQGKFLSGVELDRGVHPQPEGMVIDKQGFLYISSEARGGIATLNIYHPLNVH